MPCSLNYGSIGRGFCAVLLALLAGCGPQIPEEELGRVVFELPEIPSGYEPYELPDLSPSMETAPGSAPANEGNDPKSASNPPAAEAAEAG